MRTHQGQPVASRVYSFPNKDVGRIIVALGGAGWKQLGPPLKGIVRSYASFKGSLYAAAMPAEMGVKSTFGVARLSGTQWLPVGMPALASAGELLVVQDRLIALDLSIPSSPAFKKFTGDQWLAFGVATNITPVSTLSRFRATPWMEGLVVLGSVATNKGGYSSPFARLACTCPSDCDASGSLDIDDFICFQSLYAVGDLASDCDEDGALTIDDFACFQAGYAVGC